MATRLAIRNHLYVRTGDSGSFLCPKLQICNSPPRAACQIAIVSISAFREGFFRIIGWRQRKRKETSICAKGGITRTTEQKNAAT